MEDVEQKTPPRFVRFVSRTLGIEPGEFAAVAWSCTYFACIMSSYFMLRPVRETMAIAGGVQNIPWLFTGTFTVMILCTPVFGWITSRFPRGTFLPWIYYFFIANILFFYAAFTYVQNNDLDMVWIGRAFFIWLSVFNLFVVSVFWSFMADIYSRTQSRRLFGVISAGGSIGAIVGPAVTTLLVTRIGSPNLLPLSALLLLATVYCVYRLRKWIRKQDTEGATEETAVTKPRLIGGGAWAGAKFVASRPYFAAIALALACANFLGGATYIYVAQLVSDAFEDPDRQTQVFAIMDTMVNTFAFIGQLLIVRHSVRKLGIGGTLALLPAISVIGFALLALNPTFIVIAGLQVMRRSLGFGFTKPTTDMLYAVVSKEAKYKAKNFVETAVYRGWDVITSWTIRSMSGIGLSGIALVCVPIAMAWGFIALWLGREYKRRDKEITNNA